ncbi:efflux RND transporter periplasmic adaptor subunit [candidate division KSB1 bacterium]|nr:efflux RND transporter periplasmic adaptor subunit [candidate division KSB1 bacterium]
MKTKTKVFLGVGLLLLIALIIFANIRFQQKQKTKVETQKIEERELRAVVSASGKIRAKTSVDISASTTGKVVGLAVDEGDVVRRGQALLRIDPTPAETQVRQIQASLAAARASFDLERANLEQSQQEADRQNALFEKKLTSEEFLQKAQTALNVSKLRVSAAQQDISRFDAMLKSAQHELSKVNLLSDIDGVVVKRNIEEGENVFVGAFNNPATVLLTIADLSIIEAEVEVDETDIVNVHVDQEVAIKVDAYPDSSFKGKVTKVGRSPILGASSGAQQQATSFEVIVQLISEIPRVRPGLSCKADITTGYREKALSVPIQALTLRKPSELKAIDPKEKRRKAAMTNGESDTTNVKEKEMQGAFVVVDGKASFREVKTGIAGDRYFEALSGLQKDDEVITGPFSALRRLREGDLVEASKAAKKTEEKE